MAKHYTIKEQREYAWTIVEDALNERSEEKLVKAILYFKRLNKIELSYNYKKLGLDEGQVEQVIQSDD